jgi:hypothetical protein
MGGSMSEEDYQGERGFLYIHIYYLLTFGRIYLQRNAGIEKRDQETRPTQA